ncbi:MAG: hypothetical protein M1818_007588 [Claussenomyces sp. TS43310]|nr:MAG: hypothetical protein M1818_007588 [Claussenomyces sp. TS43310]
MDGFQARIVAVTVLFLVLGYFMVALRTYVRVRLLKYFGKDDWLIVLSLAIFTILAAFVFMGVHYGIGLHDQGLPPSDGMEAIKFLSLSELAYIWATGAIKTSVAFFLLRIFTNRLYIVIMWITVAAVWLWCFLAFFYILFQCHPVEYAWNRTIPGGSCQSPRTLTNLGYSFSAMSIFVDLEFALLPIPTIWKSQMNLKMKLSVAFILAMGVFASIACIVRVKYVAQLEDVDDILYAFSNGLIWTVIEPGIGITAASAATLRPLLRLWNVSGFTTRLGRSKLDTTTGGRSRSYAVDNFSRSDNTKVTITADRGAQLASQLSEDGYDQELALEQGRAISKQTDVEIEHEGAEQEPQAVL